MRVLFDALALPPFGGAKSSALGWMRSVARLGSEHRFWAAVSSPETSLEGLGNLEQIVAPMDHRFGVRLWAQRNLPRLVRKLNIDLVHFAKNHGCFGISCPTVITINDLNRLHYPNMFSRADVIYWRTIQRAILRTADRIIAISKNTKMDLLDVYRLPESKIQVIYPAVGEAFHRQGASEIEASTLERYGIREPYILSVGGLAKHKNVYTSLCAFHSLVDQGHLQDVRFVVVGERFHTHNDQRLVDVSAIAGDRVLFTGVVDDDDLPAIYGGASLFVYPSLYEGFGLAPIEAMACGVPVLASQAGSLPEVLGQAAWTVPDPTNVEALAEGMLQILTDAETREMYETRGRENARRFSWSRTAEETLRLYQHMIHSK